MKKKAKKLMATTMAIGMVSASGLSSIASAQGNNDIEKVIKSINDKVKSMPEIEYKLGFEIDPNINIKTNQMQSVIVELKEDPIAVLKSNEGNTYNLSSAEEKVKASHDKFKSFISKSQKSKSINKKLEIVNEYDTVFNGMAINIAGNDIEKLLECDEVKTIYKNEQVNLELPQQNDKVKQGEIAPFMLDSKNDIGVTKLHEEDIKGEGIKVGVLDTGVDYNHPDLKDNYKGGYDFVDDDNDPMETTPADWKESGEPEFNRHGSSYYTSHGTHVSGTVLGNGKSNSEFSVVGVAPEADLYAYRVLGPYGSGWTDDIIAAIDKSVKDGMDVINLSLGSAGGDQFDPLTIACNNATKAGVVTVLANGNSGPNDSTVGTPAVSPLSISVGASTTGITLALYDMTIGGSSIEGQTFAKSLKTSMEDFNDLEIVDCEAGYEGSFEGAKGKIALMGRGGISFDEKIRNAKNAGVKYAIIYNSMPGEIPYYIGESSSYVPTIGLSMEEGKLLKNEIANGNNKLSLKISGETKTEKDLLGDFSSRGPVPDSYEIKPDITAPGVSIFSTYPEFINNMDENEEDYNSAYARISGTSMAAPHVAGLAALIKQENKDFEPADVKLALMNTANDLKLEYGVNEVGSGVIDAYEAVKSGITIKNKQISLALNEEGAIGPIEHETGSISFGRVIKDGEDKKLTDELIIKNSTKKSNSFDVSVEYIAPGETHTGLDAKANGVKLHVKETAYASKGKETKLGVSITIPKEAQKGLYQGYINLVSTRNKDEKYQIPFSVNYMEEGIESVDHLREGNSTKYFELFDPMVSTIMELNSHMKEIYVFVEDENEKIVGLANYGQIISFPLNVPVRFDLYEGMILPIDENGNIGGNWEPLKEGKYNIKYVTKDARGNLYEASHDTWVDNTPPEIRYDENSKPGVYEINEEKTTFNISGKSYDDGIENSILDQSWTNLYKYDPTNFITLEMHIPQESGEFNIQHNIDLREKEVDKLGFTGIDIFGAGNLREREDFFFVKEGSKYAYSSFDKTVVKPNDSAKMNVKLANIDDFKNGSFDIATTINHEIVDVKLTDEFVALAKKKGYEFEISSKELGERLPYKDYSVDIVATKESEEVLAVDCDVFEVTLKASGDVYYTPDMYDIFEEAKIEKANINGVDLDNVLNSTFRYDVK
ncbi:MAG: S8 family serine peptidase [Peptostreptococcaceae bacterium]